MRVGWALYAVLASGLACDDGDGESAPDAHSDAGFLPPDCAPVESPVQQRCAPQFMSGDGVCRVAPDHCPPGAAPSRHEGCVPVGVDCPDVLRDEQGLCRPGPALQGNRPTLLGESAGVGPARCAPELMRDGVCVAPADACAGGAFPVPSLGCVDLTAVCDEPQPDGAHVVEGATPGGDGSVNSPFRTVAEALSSGARVMVLGVGTYQVPPLNNLGEVEIHGRCAGQTVLVPPPDLVPLTTVRLVGSQVIVRRVTLRSEVYCVRVAAGSVSIEQSHFDRCGVGVHALSGGEARVFQSDLAESALTGANRGVGARTDQGGIVRLESSALRGSERLQAETAGTFIAADSVIADAAVPPSDEATTAGAMMAIADSVLARNAGQALLARGEGTAVSLARTAVVDTAPAEHLDGDPDVALDVDRGAALEVVDSILTNNSNLDVRARSGARVTLTRSVSQASRPVEIAPGDFSGAGLLAFGDAGLTVEDSAVVGHPAAGVVGLIDDATGAGPSLNLSGLFLRNGRGPSSAGGVLVEGADHVRIHDALFEDNARMSLIVGRSGQVDLQRVTVRSPPLGDEYDYAVLLVQVGLVEASGALHIWSPSSQALGLAQVSGELAGLVAQADGCGEPPRDEPAPVVTAWGGEMTLRQVLLSGGCEVNLVALKGADVTCEDCVLFAPRLGVETSATNALAHSNSMLTLRETVLSDALGLSAAVGSSRGRLDVLDSVVLRTRPSSDGTMGVGLVTDGGSLVVENTLVESPRVAGVVAYGGALTIHDTLISDPSAGNYFTPTERLVVDRGGDGVHAQDADVDLQGVAVRGASRAGLLLSGSSGSVNGGWIHDSVTGVGYVGAGERPHQGVAFCGNEIDVGELGQFASEALGHDDLPESNLPEPEAGLPPQ